MEDLKEILIKETNLQVRLISSNHYSQQDKLEAENVQLKLSL